MRQVVVVVLAGIGVSAGLWGLVHGFRVLERAASVAEAQGLGRGPVSHVPVCGPTPPGFARCFSRNRTDPPAVGRTPSRRSVASPDVVGNGGGYDPSFLQS